MIVVYLMFSGPLFGFYRLLKWFFLLFLGGKTTTTYCQDNSDTNTILFGIDIKSIQICIAFEEKNHTKITGSIFKTIGEV
jgi:hypothetical protein